MDNYSSCLLQNDSHSCSAGNENNLFTSVICILLVIVMSIGVVGNLLVIYVVLNYGRLKTVTNTYLLHLAISDLVFLSGIPFLVSFFITRAWIFGSFVCKLFFLTQGVNQYTSIIILALLSFDRYLAVCHSAKSIIWRSRVNPNLLLILTWILSFVLMLPIITFTATIQAPGSSKVQCTVDFPVEHSLLLYFIFVAYTSTITFVLPLSLMTYFYIQIVCRLKHRVSQQHRRSRTSMRTRRKVSVLVLVVISVHIFCCSPYWAFQFINASGFLSQNSAILVPTSSITQFLLFVNSSTNPILYAFLSEIFRLSFKRVFYCCLSTNDNQYLHEKTIIKKNSAINTNESHSQRMKKAKIALRTVPLNKHDPQSTTNNQLLSDSLPNRQTNLNLNNGQSRHSSLAPTISVFSLEPSFVSET